MKLADDLLKRCIDKDRRAQFELYRVCYSPLMQVCIRYQSNQEEAKELLNQGFLKILNNLEKYRENTPFEAWIRRIMINTVIDNYRRNKQYKSHMETRDFSEDYSVSHPMDTNEAEKEYDAKDLRDLIAKLPEVGQRVFNLHVVDGYSHEEISKMLGISEGTSRWHLSNSRKQLRKMLAGSMRALQTFEL